MKRVGVLNRVRIALNYRSDRCRCPDHPKGEHCEDLLAIFFLRLLLFRQLRNLHINRAHRINMVLFNSLLVSLGHRVSVTFEIVNSHILRCSFSVCLNWLRAKKKTKFPLFHFRQRYGNSYNLRNLLSAFNCTYVDQSTGEKNNVRHENYIKSVARSEMKDEQTE